MSIQASPVGTHRDETQDKKVEKDGSVEDLGDIRKLHKKAMKAQKKQRQKKLYIRSIMNSSKRNLSIVEQRRRSSIKPKHIMNLLANNNKTDDKKQVPSDFAKSSFSMDFSKILVGGLGGLGFDDGEKKSGKDGDQGESKHGGFEKIEEIGEVNELDDFLLGSEINEPNTVDSVKSKVDEFSQGASGVGIGLNIEGSLKNGQN